MSIADNGYKFDKFTTRGGCQIIVPNDVMNTLRKWIRDSLGFSGREINGFLILLPLMLILIMAIPAYKSWMIARTDDFSDDVKTLDSLVALWQTATETPPEENPSPTLFPFDPNKASETELLALGFPAALSRRIANYRQKGGLFRIKRDLLKIYGLDSSLYMQLQAYILLPDSVRQRLSKPPSRTSRPPRYIVKTFDLNIADTSQLKSVTGIGSVLASRIVKFRDKLGGFITQQQVSEVYGLDSTTVENLWRVAFISEGFVPKWIDLNRATEEELSEHPYISRSMARAIVAYRFQHGAFSRVEDIRNLRQLNAQEIERILPYLTIN